MYDFRQFQWLCLGGQKKSLGRVRKCVMTSFAKAVSTVQNAPGVRVRLQVIVRVKLTNKVGQANQ